MPDYYRPDDPTEPLPPRSYNQNQGPQGKLVVGSFQNPPSAQRQPYQYAPSRQRPDQAYPNSNRSSYPQPGQVAGRPIPPRPRRRKVRAGRIGCLSLVAIVLVIAIFAFITIPRVLAFGSAISPQAPLSTQTGYMGTSDRTNLLIMGYGGGTHQGADLTDSMSIVSVLPQNHHTSLVALPRDLWVQNPEGSGQYSKVNAVYEVAYNTEYQAQKQKGASDTAADLAARQAGGAAAAAKAKLITGLDVKYWLTIDFTGFKDLIDSIGGIDVNVPNTFNACYPKNDDSTVDASWITVQFNKGEQHMDGATAIEFARAREPMEVCSQTPSINQTELTDFARSARQQIMIKAVLSKIKQVSTWPHLYNAMDALQKTIYTNLSLADLGEFATHMDLNGTLGRIGLSNQNVLQDGQSDDGQYILTPKDGNWQNIINYVNQNLYN